MNSRRQSFTSSNQGTSLGKKDNYSRRPSYVYDAATNPTSRRQSLAQLMNAITDFSGARSNDALGSSGILLKGVQEDESPITGVRVPDGSATSDVKIAHRRVIVCTLLQSLVTGDEPIACMDISPNRKLMAVATGKVVYLVDLENLEVRQKLGRQEGDVTKGNIRHCCFDSSGSRLATTGDGKCVAIWDTARGLNLKMLEGHAGSIYMCQFSPYEHKIYSCADDGKVLVWDCNAGQVITSNFRHAAAVRSFVAFQNPKNGDEIVFSGDGNGCIKSWDVMREVGLETVDQNPGWKAADGPTLQGWVNQTAPHSGGIVTLTVSKDMKYLASGAADNTCKVWSIKSYEKPLEEAANYNAHVEASMKRLEGLIDVTEENLGGLGPHPSKINPPTELNLGEIDPPYIYHTDLIFTLRHEAPVICCAFTEKADIIVTGSLDSTLRLWSTRRGQLIFQINLPNPPSSIHISGTHIYCVSKNRIMQFEYHARVDNELKAMEEEKATQELLNPTNAETWQENVGYIGTREPSQVLLSLLPPTSVQDTDMNPNLSTREKSRSRVLLSMSTQQLGVPPSAKRSPGTPGQSSEQDYRHLNPEEAAAMSLSPKSPIKTPQTPGAASTPRSRRFQTPGGLGRSRHESDIMSPAQVTNEELKTMLGQGLVDPQFLLSMIQETDNADTMQVLTAMQEMDMDPSDVLRMMANSDYDPQDILVALSEGTDKVAFQKIMKEGKSIDAVMKKMNFKPAALKSETDRNIGTEIKKLPIKQNVKHDHRSKSPDVMVQMDYPESDRRRPAGQKKPAQPNASRKSDDDAKMSELMNWMNSKFAQESGTKNEYFPSRHPRTRRRSSEDDYDDDEDYDSEDFEFEITGVPVQPLRFPKGKILHFIPAEQIKLLRDVQANRKINPIFYRNLGIQEPRNLQALSEFSKVFADYDADRLPSKYHSGPFHGAARRRPNITMRYNEPIKFMTGNRISMREAVGRGKLTKIPGLGSDLLAHAHPLTQHRPPIRRTIENLLKPTTANIQRMKVRGMNVSFDDIEHVQSDRNAGQRHGKIISQPLVYRSGKKTTRPPAQFIIGNASTVKEHRLL